ncbi:hypothetical protein [Microbacterium sp. cf046]|nr:hypothetical protein [Microbacterium sp. cf046]
MTDPETRRERVSPTRVGIWVVVSAVGLYMVVSGLIGVFSGGA